MKWLKKWKLVDSSKYKIIPNKFVTFILNEEQYKKARNAKKYIFVPNSIGINVYAVLKDNTEIDITDCSVW